MFRSPFRAPFGRGIQTKKIAEGGSEVSIGIATEGGGQKIAVGGSEVSLSITTTGGGIKIIHLGGAETTVYITVEAGGMKLARSPPAEVEMPIATDGGGIKIAEGGSEAAVGVATEGGGVKADYSAYVYIGAEGAGVKTGVGGTEATIVVTTETTGEKIGSGGSETAIGVSTEGGGAKRAVSGAETGIVIGTEGAGVKRAVGGAEPGVKIEAEGAGFKTAVGGSEAVVGVATEGGGGVYASGGGEVSVGVATESGGVKKGQGGAETGVAIQTTGGGKKIVPPAYEPDRELRAKVLVTVGGATTEYDDQNIGAISLDETVNPDDSLVIGTAASAKLELTLTNIPADTELDGATIEPRLGFIVDGTVDNYIPLGVFNVEEVDWQKDGEIARATLTCFDNMVRLETAYILSSLTYPASLRAVAQEVAQKAGVTFNAASLAAIPTTPVDELMGYTLREAIGLVASYMGGFAIFNRAGELEVSTYLSRRAAQGALPDISPANCISFETSENEFTIGRLACQAGEDEDGNPLILVSGLTGKEITFENPWMTQGRLDVLLQELSGLSYMPYSLSWQGDPALRTGDTVSIADRKGNTYTTLIMEQNLRYDGGLGATAEAKGKTELAQEFQSAGPLTLKLSRQASVKAYADRLVQMLADGEFEDGTFIDGNMVVSPIIAGMECRITGEIKVGGLGNNVAGISGDGSAASSIRFWAGHATKAQAPFRVAQDGSLYASKAEITGKINAESGTFSGEITVTGKIKGGTIEGVTFTGGSINIRNRAWIDADGSLAAASGNFKVDWNGDGVYNTYSGAARWKYTGSSYLYQSSSEFRIHFSPTEIFNVDSSGNARVFGNLRYDGGLYYNGSRGILSNDIRDGAVTESKISSYAVTSDKIDPGAVTSSKLGAKSVLQSKIQNGVVGTLQLVNNAVTSAKSSGTSATVKVAEAGSAYTIQLTFTNGLLTGHSRYL